MTLIDWLIVVALNASVFAYGLYLARGTHTSSEWFLGARALPWWAIGVSMFATNVDSADIVAVTGNTYNEGLHIITVYAIGSGLGGILAAFLVAPAMYRAGYYTNAEYLEARFGPSMRLTSALIQLQYRSSMLGLMIVSMHVLLTDLAEIPGGWAWVLIVSAVLISGTYTAWGGLKSVVYTDAAQGIIMMVGGMLIFFAVYQAIGGWSGLVETLEGSEYADLPHVGRYTGKSERLSPLVVVLGWTIVGSGYWTVNHTQTMRLMGARSVWDMKMAATFGVAASLPVMIACACLGVFGRAIPHLSALDNADKLYPLMAREYLGVGMRGVVVAGVVAAGVSTFDSMGSALSAVFTRDIYARFLVRSGTDEHYVLAGRVATVGVLTLGFLYLPFIFLQENMLKAFTTLIPVFVTPLFTVYLLGVATPVHRWSGPIGLLTGAAYGVLALVDREIVDLAFVPYWLSERWPALIWSLLITSTSMLVVTLVCGASTKRLSELNDSGWLARSREQLPPLKQHPFSDASKSYDWIANLSACGLMLACFALVFWLFW